MHDTPILPTLLRGRILHVGAQYETCNFHLSVRPYRSKPKSLRPSICACAPHRFSHDTGSGRRNAVTRRNMCVWAECRALVPPANIDGITRVPQKSMRAVSNSWTDMLPSRHWDSHFSLDSIIGLVVLNPNSVAIPL